MNWLWLRPFPQLDTRARFVAQAPRAAALLDLGASDGETLGHIAELRPDLRLFAADKFGQPEKYPARCEFCRADFESETLCWLDASMDTITCMHLVEHLRDPSLLLSEIARLLKPGGRAYFETPHPKSLTLPNLRHAPVSFTMNFYDDPTHTQLVSIETLAQQAKAVGLRVESFGTSRNWLFAAVHPLFTLLPPSRKKYTAQVHWLGWSAFLIVCKPA
jgi:2-polyprenyl-3-methyl-5-hydroxy-6-metoxy-1,4-benzoquinol methylase